MNDNDIASTILKKINISKKILIIASKPIDYDSLGTTLLIRWWLIKMGKKESDIYTFTFSYIPDNVKNFPSLNLIIQNQINKVDFNYFDLIILPDGNSWRQFLTNDYMRVLIHILKNKFINIDHHELGELNQESELSGSVIRVKDSCTAKIFYDYFIKDSKVDLDLESATWIYMALIGDTGTFNYGIYSDTFSFAEKLLSLGVDHEKAVTFDIPKRMLDFTVWAIHNTKYYKDIFTTILSIDESKDSELKALFGKDWDHQDLDKFYKNYVMRSVEAYPYSIIFKARDNNSWTEMSWRSKNFGTKIELMNVLKKAGFLAGGHKNAGGGSAKLSIKEVENKFIKAMKDSIVSLN